MILEQLLQDVTIVKTYGPLDIKVEAIAADSRKVTPKTLFVAIRGTQTDGHQYIGKAIELGANAIVCETMPATYEKGVTYIQVKDAAESLGWIASAFYDYPSEKMIMIGVTGTNGKTTIATLLYQIFRSFGHKVGLLSTVCNYVDAEPIPSTHTTPDALELQALLAKMAASGCRYAFMEVSSHAIDQRRIAGIFFDGGIFTNITRDHLDYHKTFDNYLAAKKRFFDDLPNHAFALTNIDDKNGKIMVQNTKANVYTYSTQSMADFKGKIVEESMEGMQLNINSKEVFVQLVGNFNVSNLLAIYGASFLLHSKSEEILLRMSLLHPVAGRLETIHSKDGKTAVVDYAHTPDALENVLKTLREVNKKGKLVTVIGCGGNRDKGKRPQMAKIAVKGSDQVVLTSDNPRFEKPEDILNDMLAGLSQEEQNAVLVIENREQAIKTAYKFIQPGDVLLIAGKGHETYQEIEGVKHPFNDKEIIQKLLNA